MSQSAWRATTALLLVLDNYDSFVHNLARYARLSGARTEVIRSDAIDASGVADLRPDAILLSPGPGTPRGAGCCIEVVRRLHAAIPMLGVCLGHQAIVEAFGGSVTRAPAPRHGHTSLVEHGGDGVFAGLPSPFTACRYHSLAADDALPTPLHPTARSDDGVLMAVQHSVLPIYGVQFHPEAVLSEHGQRLIDNFWSIASGTLPR